jgi:hypothetical protein
MKTLLRFATTSVDRKNARDLRDEIRAINVARYGRDPDGEMDPRMDGRTLCAYDRARLIATLDVHWGGDGALAPAKLERHLVAERAADAAPTSIVVLDDPMVHPEYGTYPVSIELKEAATRFALRQRARYVFSACHPTESSIHTALGFRAASAPTASRMWGARLPLVLDLADVDFLRQVRAPFADAAAQAVAAGAFNTAPAPAPAGQAEQGEQGEQKLDSDAVWRQVFELQRQARASGAAFLATVEQSEIGRLLLGSRVLTCARGVRILKRGERGRDMFLVLTGEVEVRHEARTVAMLGAGDVFGEIGLVLDMERTSDVYAATDDTRCLRISEEQLQDITQKDPALAARVAMGIAKALCLKLVRTSGLA